MTATSDELEAAIIARLTRAVPATAARVGPGDDAAILPDGTALTVDTLVEGRHWDARLAPADVGWKAVAVSVSDLAAAGARPSWMLLSLCLPQADHAWIEGFSAGLGEAAARWGVSLVGGDTVGTPGPRCVSISMGGRLVAEPIGRGGARAGDELWVTGALGLAGAGYSLANPEPGALAALQRPDPPLEFALALARIRPPTAMMDLSDGLAADLPRLCARSGVGAIVDPAALPRDPALPVDALALQTSGGDDYQLLFSAPPADQAEIQRIAGECRVRVTRIGRIIAGSRASLAGMPWPPPIFSHWQVA
jgi:thiamine-monophosphate kinase